MPSMLGEYSLNQTSTPMRVTWPRSRKPVSTPRRRMLMSTPANGCSPSRRRTCRMSPTRIWSLLSRAK